MNLRHDVNGIRRWLSAGRPGLVEAGHVHPRGVGVLVKEDLCGGI